MTAAPVVASLAATPVAAASADAPVASAAMADSPVAAVRIAVASVVAASVAAASLVTVRCDQYIFCSASVTVTMYLIHFLCLGKGNDVTYTYFCSSVTQ